MDGTVLHDVSLSSPFSLSYGIEAIILDRLSKMVSSDGGPVLFREDELRAVVRSAFSHVYDPKEVDQGLSELTARVDAHLRELAEAARVAPEAGPSTKPQAKDDRGFGSGLREWLEAMGPETLCMYLANFDPERALDLYWYVDKRLVSFAADQKIRAEWMYAQTRYEACVFGFGGGYKDEGDVEFDLTKGEGVDTLKSLGF